MYGSAPFLNSDEPGAVLRLEGISFAHGPLRVVDDFSLSLGAGSLTTLLGPSGSGKTTLLQLICGHLTPLSGKIWIGGVAAEGLALEKRGLGVVHQQPGLFPHLSAVRNVSFGLEVRGTGLGEAVRVAEGMLAMTGLEAGAFGRYPHQLSGGQQQRVALARALAFRPGLLLLDEPFNGLDRELRQQMRAELKRIQRECGITTLLVTHDQEEALALSDTVVAMNHGRLVQAGPPSELYRRPRDAWLAGFLGEANLVTVGGYLGGLAGELLLVRPEELQADPLPGADGHHLKGVVEAVAFYGATCLASFRADGLVWKILVAGEKTPCVGQEIAALLPAGAGWNVTRRKVP